jgi:hypothetical protein
MIYIYSLNSFSVLLIAVLIMDLVMLKLTIHFLLKAEQL